MMNNWNNLSALNIASEIGNALRERRIHLKMDQKTLSELTGVSVNTINRIENAKSSIQLDNFISIMRALKLINELENIFKKSMLINTIEDASREKQKIHTAERFRKSSSENAGVKKQKDQHKWEWKDEE